MNLELRSVVAAGDLKNERLTIRVKADSDVGDYLIAKTGVEHGEPTTSISQVCWLPYEPVSSGDLVVIYTKEGSPRKRKLKSGKTAHFYYLDLTQPIWDDSLDGALLLYAPTWEFKSASELKQQS